jgi:hypothetical protein
MPLHYVLLKIGNKTYKKKVSTQGCSDVDDYKDAIKNKFSPLLDSYNAAQLILFTPDEKYEIDPETPITDLKEVPWKPMVVTVDELPTPAPIGSSKKQLTYKKISVESSCRKFFDALAAKLTSYYKFQWGPKDENSYATFGDVLYAYDNNSWKYIFREKSYEDRTDSSGFTQVAKLEPRLPIRLPELFTKDEWEKLRAWNQKTNKRIHDGDVPRTSTGKFFIIIPHVDYIVPGTVDFFKRIGVKGRLYDDESRLEVKDEGELSGSSGSDSSTPEKEKQL